MPLSLSCPCGKHLRVADTLAGKRIRCPVCQAILPVPATVVSPPAPLPVATPAPPASPPPLDVAAWGQVHDGLGNWLLGNRIVLITVSVQLVFALVVAFLALTDSMHPSDLAGLNGVVNLGLLLPIVAGTVIMYVGIFRLCAVPESSGAKGVILATTVLWVVGQIIGMLDVIHRVLPARSQWFAPAWLTLLWLPMLTIGAGCFLMFLRRVATHLGNEKLARRITWFVLVWLGGPVLILLAPVLFAVVALVLGLGKSIEAQFFFLALWLAGSLVFMGAFFRWLWNLIGSAQNTVAEALAKAEHAGVVAETPVAPLRSGRNRVILAVIGGLLLLPGVIWPAVEFFSYLPKLAEFQREQSALEERLRAHPEQTGFSRLRMWGHPATGWALRGYNDTMTALFLGSAAALVGFLLLWTAWRQPGIGRATLVGAGLGGLLGLLACLLFAAVPYLEGLSDSRGTDYPLSETLLWGPASGLLLGLLTAPFIAWIHQQLCRPRQTPKPASV